MKAIPSESYCVLNLVAVRPTPPGGSVWSEHRKDFHIFYPTGLAVSSKDGEVVVKRRVDLLGLPLGSCTVAALEDKIEWVTFVGCSALNEVLLPVELTWNSYRQSPLGRPEPTMGRPALDRCGMAELKRAESVVDSEGEGPEERGEFG